MRIKYIFRNKLAEQYCKNNHVYGFTHSSFDDTAYISLIQIAKDNPDDIISHLIFTLSHEGLHIVVRNTQDNITSLSLDSSFMRKMLKDYQGGKPHTGWSMHKNNEIRYAIQKDRHDKEQWEKAKKQPTIIRYGKKKFKIFTKTE